MILYIQPHEPACRQYNRSLCRVPQKDTLQSSQQTGGPLDKPMHRKHTNGIHTFLETNMNVMTSLFCSTVHSILLYFGIPAVACVPAGMVQCELRNLELKIEHGVSKKHTCASWKPLVQSSVELWLKSASSDLPLEELFDAIQVCVAPAVGRLYLNNNPGEATQMRKTTCEFLRYYCLVSKAKMLMLGTK